MEHTTQSEKKITLPSAVAELQLLYEYHWLMCSLKKFSCVNLSLLIWNQVYKCLWGRKACTHICMMLFHDTITLYIYMPLDGGTLERVLDGVNGTEEWEGEFVNGYLWQN